MEEVASSIAAAHYQLDAPQQVVSV